MFAQVPTPIPNFTDVASLAAGTAHVCGVLSNGTINCVGSNFSGELGNGSFGNSSTVPVQVIGINTARQVTANQGWTCALLADGRVQCWGYNYDLGDGVTTDSSTPVTVQGLIDATQVSAGLNHACAVRRDGTIYCWGRSFNRGDSAGYGSLRGVESVHCGADHSCALLSDGSAYCWGQGSSGALGAGPSVMGASAPVRVLGP
jgi:alpha-tubulin suppressor-like RCC1 family protein